MAISKSIFVVGEAFGESEAKIGKGFVGASGCELLRMLNEAGVIELTSADRDYFNAYYNSGDPNQVDMIWNLHPEVYRTNVFNFRPHGNQIESLCGVKAEGILGYPALIKKGKFISKEYQHELDRLGDEIIALDPNLIICLGNTALWALAGRTGISKLRGTTCVSTHLVSGYKLLCTYHPAAVIQQWELRPVTVIDLSKATYECEYPEVRRPSCEIWIEPDIDDIKRFINEYINESSILSVDIETSGQQITCIGFAPSKQVALVIPIHDERRKGRSYWPTQEAERECWALIRGVLEDKSIAKLFQNGLYDIAFLLRSYGIRVFGAREDTMLLHHALSPESLKGLGFLGSVYTDHGSWKSDRHTASTIKRDA